jgi:hypothetical protein
MKQLRYFQIAAITLLLALGNNTSSFCQSPQNTPSQVQKVKDKVRKIGLLEDVTVKLLNGKEYYGYVTGIEPDHFEITEVDLKQRMAFDYMNVKKVRKGYGDRYLLTGKRLSPRAEVIITIAVVGGIITFLGVTFP